VILDTMEMGVVAEANQDPDKLHQPVIKVISDSLGAPLAEPRLIDLSEIDPTAQVDPSPSGGSSPDPSL